MNYLTLNNEQQVHFRLNPKTAKGNPAAIDGMATFTVTEGDCTVVPDEDGLGATIVSGDSVGNSVVKITADADTSEEVKEISDEITVTVTQAQAANVGITADEPSLKP
jgi:hypothetical protein